MKQNDWIIANINNPNLSVADFLDVGMSLGNTLLLPKDQYLKSDYILLRFQKDGQFDQKSFDKFYNLLANKFSQFEEDDHSNSFVYDLFNTSRKAGDKVKDPNFKLYTVANPTRLSSGITGRNEKGEQKLSISELAQTQKVYDPSTNTWSDKTLNETALFKNPVEWIKNLFTEPVVIAKYDSDGTHIDPFTGEIIEHKKGDYKTNKEGTYYAEKLNGRSLIGLDVISAFDTLTIDGEGINKYDFFDSDSLDKSVSGTLAKSAAAIAPMLIGGPISTIYSAAMIGKETLKTLPMLSNMLGAWFGMEDSKLLNTLAGVGSKFSMGTSDYSKQNSISIENLANMITNVALQWGQLKAIALGVSKLLSGKDVINKAYAKAATTYQKEVLDTATRSGMTAEKFATLTGLSENAFKEISNNPSKIADFISNLPKDWEKSAIGQAAVKKFVPDAEKLMQSQNQLGADLSLAYMALVSNTDVYDSMIEAGASKKEAAAVALGSTLGMFGVDKYAHLGELFFDDLTADSKRAMRGTFKKEAVKWGKEEGFLKKAINALEPENLLNYLKNLILKGINFGKKTLGLYYDDLQFHSTKFLGKALGEGIEEVSEELVSDSAKSIYELAGDLGFNTSVKDVGAWDNMLERYSMSFLGGAIGGGLFAGIDIWNNGFHNKDLKDELTYLVKQHKTEDILNELDTWHSKGKLGNTNLSINTENITDSEGNKKKIFTTASEGLLTLNDFVYNKIKETILLLDAIINGNLLGLSDDEVFLQMILSDVRLNNLNKALKDDIKATSYTLGYLQEYLNMVEDYVNTEKNIELAGKTLTGNPKDNPVKNDEELRNMSETLKQIKAQNIAKLQQHKAELDLKKQDFLDGKLSFPYTKKMLWAVDPNLSGDFYYNNFLNYCIQEYGNIPDKLTDSDYKEAVNKYRIYKKEQSLNIHLKFALFEDAEKATDSWFKEAQENEQLWKDGPTMLSKIWELINKELKLYTYNTPLDFEGENEESDSFKARKTLLEGESPEEFEIRLGYRAEKIKTWNDNQFANLELQIISLIDENGGSIDNATLRLISRRLGFRKTEVLKELLEDSKENIDTLIDPEEYLLDDIPDLLKNFLKDIIPEIKTIALENLDNPTKSNDLEEQIKKVIDSKIYNPKIDKIVDLLDLGLTTEMIDTAVDMVRDKAITEGINISDELILSSLFDDGVLSNLWQLSENDISFENGTIKINKANEESLIGSQLLLQYLNGTLDDYIDNLSKYFSDDIGAINRDTLNEHLYDLALNPLVSDIKTQYNDYDNNIKIDPRIKLLDTINSKVTKPNKLDELLKILSIKYGKNPLSIETILLKLYQRFNDLDSMNDFVIEDSEAQAFDEFEDIIKLAEALLYSKLKNPTEISVQGFSATLNLFAKDHKIENYEEVSTLDSNIIQALIRELNLYINEIGEIDPTTKRLTPLSWRAIAAANSANKQRLFIQAEEKWNTILLKFLTSPALRHIKLDDLEIDLLKGSDSVPNIITEENLNKLGDILYDNFLTILATSKLSMYEFLKKTNLLNEFIQPGVDIIQTSTSIDQNIEWKHLNFFDKTNIFLTLIGVKSSDFNKFIYDRIKAENNIAPLTIQTWITRQSIASIESNLLVKDTYTFIKDNIYTKFKIPVLGNGTVIIGNGGSGKSSVVAKHIAQWQTRGNATNLKKIWLSSFAQELVDNLKKSVTFGSTMLLTEGENALFTKFINATKLKALLLDLDALKLDSKYYSFERTGEGNNVTVKLNWNELGPLNNISKEEIPLEIIIDEATHMSLALLLILDKAASKYNFHYTLLGDNKLNGYRKLGSNIDKELCLLFRTLELGITLRDSNLLHSRNIDELGKLIKLLTDSDSTLINAYSPEALTNDLKNKFHLHYFKDGDINGDIITSGLTQDLVNNMLITVFDEKTNKERKATVVWIGPSTSSEVLMLKNRGLEVTCMSMDLVLGLEFDYCVTDWDKLNIIDGPGKAHITAVNLYTAMTRGKKGSIIVSSKLQNLLGESIEDSYQAKSNSVQTAITKFVEHALENLKFIENYKPIVNRSNVLTSEESKSSKEAKLEENKPEESFNIEESIKYPITNLKDGEYKLPDKYNFNGIPYFVKIVLDNKENKTFIFGIKENNTFKPCDITNAIPIDLSIIENSIDPKIIKLLYKDKKLIVFGYLNKNKEFAATLDINPFEDLFTLDLESSVIPVETKIDSSNPEPNPEPEYLSTEELPEEIKPLPITNIPTEGLSNRGFPIMIHSSASFIGCSINNDSSWNINLEGTLKNGDIFVTKDLLDVNGKISTKENQQTLELRIILFKHRFEYKTNYFKLSPEQRDIIDETTYNEIINRLHSDKWKYKLVVRESQDTFVSKTGFKTIKPIAGNYIVECVLEFKNKKGLICELTMGLLSDPIIYSKNQSTIKENYENSLKELLNNLGKAADNHFGLDLINYKESLTKLINQLKEELIHYQDSTSDNSYIKQYKDWIDDLKDKADLNGGYYVFTSPEFYINWTLMPRFRTTLNGKELSKVHVVSKYRRLIEYYTDEIKALKDHLDKYPNLADSINAKMWRYEKAIEKFKTKLDDSFAIRCPYTIFSDAYVLTDSSKFGLDDSLKALHAVMFATNDDTLTRDELIDKYFLQKQRQKEQISKNGYYNPYIDDYNKSVRIVILDNAGLSLDEILDDLMISSRKVLQIKKGEESKSFAPWNTSYTGLRMYVAFWNYRADLLAFNRKLKEFKNSHPEIDFEKLKEYSKIEDTYLLTQKSNSSTNEKTHDNFVIAQGISNIEKYNSYILNLNEFNESLKNVCRGFRLGFTKDNIQRMYIRQMLSFDESYYDKSKGIPNGIYIEPELAEKQLNMIESIFTNILDKIISCNINKENLLTHKKGYGNSITSSTISKLVLGINEDSTNTGYSSVVEPLIDGTSQFVITSYEEGKPIGTTTYSLSKDYNDGDPILSEGKIEGNPIDLRNSKGEPLSLISIFSHIPMALINTIHLSKAFKMCTDDKNFLKLVDNCSTCDIKTHDKNGEDITISLNPLAVCLATTSSETIDEDFEDMLRVLFHGTTEDIESNALKSSFAMFPKGFFVDPLTTDSESDISKYGLKKVGQANIGAPGVNMMNFMLNSVMDDPVGFVSLNTIKEAEQELQLLQRKELIKLPINIEINCSDASKIIDIQEELNQTAEVTLEERNEVLRTSLEEGSKVLLDILNDDDFYNYIILYTLTDDKIEIITALDKIKEAYEKSGFKDFDKLLIEIKDHKLFLGFNPDTKVLYEIKVSGNIITSVELKNTPLGNTDEKIESETLKDVKSFTSKLKSLLNSINKHRNNLEDLDGYNELYDEFIDDFSESNIKNYIKELTTLMQSLESLDSTNKELVLKNCLATFNKLNSLMDEDIFADNLKDIYDSLMRTLTTPTCTLI